MSLNARVRKLSPLAALAVAAGIGCTADRDVWMTQIGDYLFEFPVDATNQGGAPGGANTVADFTVAAVDASHFDALGRMVPGTRSTYDPAVTSFGGGWPFTGHNATGDPRLPALQSTTAAFGGILVVGDPSQWTTNQWNIWTANQVGGGSYSPISGLNPNTTYTVAFFRYGLEVNGDLDHLLAAQGLPVTQPDQLVPLGGTPLGDPTVDVTSATFPLVPIQANANPFVVGSGVSTATGTLTLDFRVRSTDADGIEVLYASASADPTNDEMNRALVARNDTVATTFPRYNYFVLLEGAATTAAEAAALPQVLRVQMGADLDPATGQVVFNAYGPFPTQMTKAQLLAGAGVAGKAADLRATFRNLTQLSGALYQIWLANEETGEAFSVPGDLVATVTDEEGAVDTVAVGTSVRSFSPTHEWVTTFHTNDSIAGRDVGDFTHIMVSIETAEVAETATPSQMQPLWARFTDMAGDPEDPFGWTLIANSAVVFGTFDLGGPTRIPFTARGAARGHFHGTSPDDQFRVQFRDLDRPPVGYFYEGWLFPEEGLPFSLGGLVAPVQDNHASLDDADVSTAMSQFVHTDRILDALQLTRIGTFEGGVQPWDLDEYRLMLGPKMRGEMPTYTILGGDIPDAVAARRP